MHEWLEALQKSAKTTTPGTAAEELRRAETEAGVPLPGELGDLYSAFNGGSFEGDVVLFPLHGEGEQASVLEKTRKALVGLPVSGVWRFGLKGRHRHLFTARKSAMEQQGDGGPLPEWVQALGDEDWLYGTWEEEKRELRMYRSLSQMLNVLVPPVEREEFGDRTFARAIAAVEGALNELTSEVGGESAEGTEEAAPAAAEEPEEEPEEEGGSRELQYEYEEGPRGRARVGSGVAGREAPAPGGAKKTLGPTAAKADKRPLRAQSKPVAQEKAGQEKAGQAPAAPELPAQAGQEKGLEQAAVIAAERRVKRLAGQGKARKERGLEQAAVIAAERRVKRLASQGKARKGLEQAAVIAAERRVKRLTEQTGAAKPAAKKGGAVKAAAKKVARKMGAALKAVTRKVTGKKGAPAKAPAAKAPPQKVSGRKAPMKKAAAKKAPAKKAPAKKAPAKKAPAKKAPAKKKR
jgi:hypothetical protein